MTEVFKIDVHVAVSRRGEDRIQRRCPRRRNLQIFSLDAVDRESENVLSGVDDAADNRRWEDLKRCARRRVTNRIRRRSSASRSLALEVVTDGSSHSANVR